MYIISELQLYFSIYLPVIYCSFLSLQAFHIYYTNLLLRQCVSTIILQLSNISSSFFLWSITNCYTLTTLIFQLTHFRNFPLRYTTPAVPIKQLFITPTLLAMTANSQQNPSSYRHSQLILPPFSSYYSTILDLSLSILLILFY